MFTGGVFITDDEEGDDDVILCNMVSDVDQGIKIKIEIKYE